MLLEDIKKELGQFKGKKYAELPKFRMDYGKPPMRVNTSHPRLWVTSETLKAVKENLTIGENAEVYAKIKESADKALKSNGVLNSADGKLRWSNAWPLEELAFMYLVTGEEKYGYSAILHAYNYIETVNMENTHPYHQSIGGGAAFYAVALVYDWCYDLLTGEQKEQLVKGACERLATYFEVGFPPFATHLVSSHSTGQPILKNWTAFSLAVADEYPEIYDSVIGMVANEFVKAPKWYYKSGYNFQGCAYGMGKTIITLTNALLIKNATGVDVYDGVDFSRIPYTYLGRLRPDETPVIVGDNYVKRYYKGGDLDYVWMTFFASTVFKNATAREWFKQVTDRYERFNFSGIDSCMDISSAKFLIFNDPKIQGSEEDKYKLPLVSYTDYPFSSASVRSAWNDSCAWYTFTNMEEAYGGNHDHRDAGTFQIYYKGILALNNGIYEYGADQGYGTRYDLGYVKQTISKNGLLIYNPNIKDNEWWEYSGGQSNEHDGKRTIEEWLDGPESKQSYLLGRASGYDKNGELVYSYMASDITGAYDKESVDSVRRSTITLATGDKAHPMAYVVYDRIAAADKSFKKTFLLHTTDEPEFFGSAVSTKISGDEFTYITGANALTYTNKKGPNGASDAAAAEELYGDKYNGRLTMTTILPKNPTFRYIGGDGKRFWLNGKNAGTELIDTYPYTEAGWGRVELSPTEENFTDAFLNVMYVSDADNIDYAPSSHISSDTHDGVLTFGNVIMFSKSTAPISSEVSFRAEKTDSCSSYTYYVTGLSEGAWEIYQDGGLIKTVNADEKSGIISFRAPADKEIRLLPVALTERHNKI